MKKYIPYALYPVYWLLFFIVARLVFILWSPAMASTLSAQELFRTFWYGLRLDISFTAYVCIFPYLVWLIKSILPKLPDQKIIRVYTICVLGILSFLVVADAELYTAWGYRMDATPLMYVKNPREMAATITTAPVLLLLVAIALLIGLFYFLYNRFFHPLMKKKVARFYISDLIFSVLLVAVLFIPIRGGIQKIPINISDVYFSKKPFANHAAINLPWNISFSILNRQNTENPFHTMPDAEAEQRVRTLYHSEGEPEYLLTNARPNIVFIILESFTAKFVGHLGGEKGVTPQLDSIAAEGFAFTNIYAAGDRSEKGQIGILSAYPNQAITSIIKTPTKTRNLPAITQVLAKEGYTTSFTYGGELEFANIKSYLLQTGFDRLVDKYAFPVSLRTTSWGVHDEFVFQRFLTDLKTEPQPFFATLFTLSSHEPYDVPIHHFKGSDQTSQYRNSVYYTDSLLGDFIRKSQKESWWANTLIVLVADHGHLLPGPDTNDSPSAFHIPLVFTGGALKHSGRSDKIGSQTDIIPSLLNQLHLDASAFPWGKDLLNPSSRSFAFYSFNNGFGWVTPDGVVTVDNLSGIIRQDPRIDSTDILSGKAYMQFSYQDFLNR